jgi:DNA polymerase-4
MERIILHSDANSFYASVECLYRPEIRQKPVAVCGDPEERHGIVLTKNQIAKGYGIQTGEAIWQARQKCPELVVVPPNYPLYLHFSEMMREIYEQYSDRVEAFGLDENWLDISAEGRSFSDGVKIANEIRNRIREELGVTVSVGVSDNKIFSKLGSDMKKPDATTALPESSYEEKVWPLPVSSLLYVGRKTTKKLMQVGIITMGDLANSDTEALHSLLGKNGLTLKAFALGLDHSPVMPLTAEAALKSIGNSTTPPHDIENLGDAECIYYLLAESVSARLRAHGFTAKTLAISIRDTELRTASCQCRLYPPSNITDDLAKTALCLFRARFPASFPLRSVGLHCSGLMADTLPRQQDMLGMSARMEKLESLERSLDSLRGRFGHQIVQRGVVMRDKVFAAVNPKEDHVIHPAAFFMG